MMYKIGAVLTLIFLIECLVVVWAVVPPRTQLQRETDASRLAQIQALAGSSHLSEILALLAKQQEFQQKKLDQAFNLLNECRDGLRKEMQILHIDSSTGDAGDLKGGRP